MVLLEKEQSKNNQLLAKMNQVTIYLLLLVLVFSFDDFEFIHQPQ